jgi:uncharacterized membrane protein (GlpM family)
MAAALALWFVTALAVALWAPDDFTLSVAVGLALSLVLLLVRLRVKTANSEKTAARPRWRGVVLRGVLGGIVVDAAALLSIVSGPLVGGVFAAAPAIWSSSLYVTNRSQGLEFSRSLTKTFMRTGIMTVIPYAIAARYLFSYFGIWAGTVLAYAVIAPFAYLAWLLGDSKRLKKGTSA